MSITIRRFSAPDEKAWDEFMSDPVWIEAKAESERNGPLVADVANRILKPTPFSPIQ